MSRELREGSDALMAFQASLCQCQSKGALLDFARVRHAEMTQGESKVGEEDLVQFILGKIREQLETILSLLDKADVLGSEDGRTADNESDVPIEDTTVSGDPMMPVLCQLGGRNGGNVKAPPNLMSINALRSVYTLLELLWAWGILPSLDARMLESFTASLREPKCESFQDRLGPTPPKALLCSRQMLESLLPMPQSQINILRASCWQHLILLHKCIQHSLFSNFMLGRNLGRVLFGLLVFTEAPRDGREINVTRIVPAQSFTISPCPDIHRTAATTDTDPIPKQALRELQNIVLARDWCIGATRAEVVAALRVASQGSVWLKRRCSNLLRLILLAPRGLEAVLQGYLDGQLESAHAAQVKHQVVLLVTSVPTGMDRDEYFSNLLLAQALPLLVQGTHNGDTVLVSLMAMLVNRTAAIAPRLTSRFICSALLPLLKPVAGVPVPVPGASPDLTTATNSGTSSSTDGAGDMDEVTDVYTDVFDHRGSSSEQSSGAMLLLSVKVLLALLTAVPPSAPLLTLLTTTHTRATMDTTSPSPSPFTVLISSASRAVLSLAVHGMTVAAAKASPVVEEALVAITVLFRLARNSSGGSSGGSVGTSLGPEIGAAVTKAGDGQSSEEEKEKEKEKEKGRGAGGLLFRLSRDALLAALCPLAPGWAFASDDEGNLCLHHSLPSSAAGAGALLEMIQATQGAGAAMGMGSFLAALGGKDTETDTGETETETEEESGLSDIISVALSRTALRGCGDEGEEEGGAQLLQAGRARDILLANKYGSALCEVLLRCSHTPVDVPGTGSGTVTGTGQEEDPEAPSVASCVFLHCLQVSLGANPLGKEEDADEEESEGRSNAAQGQQNADPRAMRLHRALLAPLSDSQACSVLLLLLRQHVPIAILLGSAREVLAVIGFFLDSSVSQLHASILAAAAAASGGGESGSGSWDTAGVGAAFAASSLFVVGSGSGASGSGGRPLIQVIGKEEEEGDQMFHRGSDSDGVGEEEKVYADEVAAEVEDTVEGCTVCLAILDALLAVPVSRGEGGRGREEALRLMLAPLQRLVCLSGQMQASISPPVPPPLPVPVLTARAPGGDSKEERALSSLLSASEAVGMTASSLALTILSRGASSSSSSSMCVPEAGMEAEVTNRIEGRGVPSSSATAEWSASFASAVQYFLLDLSSSEEDVSGRALAARELLTAMQTAGLCLEERYEARRKKRASTSISTSTSGGDDDDGDNEDEERVCTALGALLPTVLTALQAESESFVYLGLLQLLREAGCGVGWRRFPHMSLGALLRAFYHPPPAASVPDDPSEQEQEQEQEQWSTRTRAMIAEAIVTVVKRGSQALTAPAGTGTGTCTGAGVAAVVAAALAVFREEGRRVRGPGAVQIMEAAGVDLGRLRIARREGEGDEKEDEEEEEEGEETSRRSSARLKRQQQRRRVREIESGSQLADSVLLRQACVSVLAECAGASGYACVGYADDLLDVVYGCLYFEVPSTSSSSSSSSSLLGAVIGSDRDRASRRSAAFLLRYVVTVLQSNLFLLDQAPGPPAGSLSFARATPSPPAAAAAAATAAANISMRQRSDNDSRLAMVHRVYRLLKRAAEDSDDVVRFHAEAGIGQVDSLVREEFSGLFEKEQVPQIRIL